METQCIWVVTINPQLSVLTVFTDEVRQCFGDMALKLLVRTLISPDSDHLVGIIVRLVLITVRNVIVREQSNVCLNS